MQAAPKKIFVFTILCVLFFSSVAYLQKAVELTKMNRKLIFPVGKRVKYKLNNGFVDAGQIQSINDSSLTINSRVIKISALNRIGRKNPGSNFRGIFLTAFGAFFCISVIENENTEGPPCPRCTTTITTDDSVTPGIIGSLVVTGLGIVILSRNATKDLSNDWTIRIIDLP